MRDLLMPRFTSMSPTSEETALKMARKLLSDAMQKTYDKAAASVREHWEMNKGGKATSTVCAGCGTVTSSKNTWMRDKKRYCAACKDKHPKGIQGVKPKSSKNKLICVKCRTRKGRHALVIRKGRFYCKDCLPTAPAPAYKKAKKGGK